MPIFKERKDFLTRAMSKFSFMSTDKIYNLETDQG